MYKCIRKGKGEKKIIIMWVGESLWIKIYHHTMDRLIVWLKNDVKMLKIGEGEALWSIGCYFEGLWWELALCHVWIPSTREVALVQWLNQPQGWNGNFDSRHLTTLSWFCFYE